MIALTCLVPPCVEPVSLEEAKSFLKIEERVTYHDRSVREAIKASRCAIETFTGRALIAQTWQLMYEPSHISDTSWWEGIKIGSYYKETGKLRLPKPPVLSVSKVSINNKEVPSTGWSLKGQHLVLDPLCINQSLIVHFNAGYGVRAEDVPAELRHALLMYVKLMVESQGENPTVLGTIHTLIRNYRVLSL